MWIWWVITTVLVVFSLVMYRVGFIKGYRMGASRILKEWKEVMKIGEEDVNDGQD